MAHTCLH